MNPGMNQYQKHNLASSVYQISETRMKKDGFTIGYSSETKQRFRLRPQWRKSNP